MGFIPFVVEIWHWGEKHSKFNPCERRKDLLRFTVWGPWNSILWFMGNSAKSCLYISVWTKVTDGLCLSHTVRLSQLTAVVLNDSSVFACCLRALCPVQNVSLPSLSHPPSIPLSSSPGCVWWTDVIISTSFILPSSKEADDCIYQALVCLRDARGTVVLHSHSEWSSAGRNRGKPLCVFDRLVNW